jgi:hypothetical protein
MRGQPDHRIPDLRSGCRATFAVGELLRRQWMPSKSRARRRSVPTILKSPMEHSLYANRASVALQRQARLQAVYEFYGVQYGKEGAEAELIATMVADKFPAGFRILPAGAPRTKKRVWDCFQRAHLVEFMEDRLAKGMTRIQAAELYRRKYFSNRGSAKGLVAEYYRAERFSRLGKLTELEAQQVDTLLWKERLKHWTAELRRRWASVQHQTARNSTD